MLITTVIAGVSGITGVSMPNDFFEAQHNLADLLFHLEEYKPNLSETTYQRLKKLKARNAKTPLEQEAHLMLLAWEREDQRIKGKG